LQDFWIEFEEGSLFCVLGDFVRTLDGEQLIRYVGVSQSVVTGAKVKVISHGCFFYHKTVESLSYALNS
jgi:G:T-mismatch repair DNA endonuclease (very short patch repair protein)